MARSDAILERLMRLHPKKIDLTLGRVLGHLDRLGRPQDRLPPVVHVAGTNGKGSAVAFMRAMLEAAGYRVHAYTSPHLVRFNERIRLAGQVIDEAALADLLGLCERVNGETLITYFEITTAAAFRAFAETPADILLLECGLGGRYDATTVALTAITPVSMDHMQFLGDTIAEIAGEKAAIQKSGVTTVVGPQTPLVAAVIEDEAKARGARLHRFGEAWHAEPGDHGLRYRSGARTMDYPAPALVGPHQVANAGLAIACLDELAGFDVPSKAIAAGLGAVDWPARVQHLRKGKLVDRLPAGCELWLDGGHNEAAGGILADVAADWTDLPLDLVFGMLDSKNPADFLSPLAPHIRRLRAIPIPGEAASLPPGDLVVAARGLGIEAEVAPNLDATLEAFRADTGGPSRLLICGSLYLAGHVLAMNG